MRVLIVGAGPSATVDKVSAVCCNFDVMITLNAAWKVAPQADLFSYEVAFRDAAVFAQQKQDLKCLALERVVFKPHALMRLSRAQLTAFTSDLRRLEHGWPPRFVRHNNISGARLARDATLLHRIDRLPMQWRGSLTMWLDLCWLAKVGTIGLIGTDLGAVSTDGHFVNHPTNTTNYQTESLLSLLKRLRSSGYLDGMRFIHFHNNERLCELL